MDTNAIQQDDKTGFFFNSLPPIKFYYELSLTSMVPVALSLIKSLRQVKEIVFPAGGSGSMRADTKEPLRLSMSNEYMRWYHHDTLWHHRRTSVLEEEIAKAQLPKVDWYEEPLERSLLPVGNRLFRKYTTLPQLSSEPPVELYALVDNTSARDIHVYSKGLTPNTKDTLLFTLDQTDVKGQYIILPN